MIKQENIDNITVYCSRFNVTPSAQDLQIIRILWDGATQEFIHECNITSVPECDVCELERVVAFRFLSSMLLSGSLTGAAIAEIVNTVNEGDTSITFAGGSKSAKDYLSDYFASQSKINKVIISRHRKLVW